MILFARAWRDDPDGSGNLCGADPREGEETHSGSGTRSRLICHRSGTKAAAAIRARREPEAVKEGRRGSLGDGSAGTAGRICGDDPPGVAGTQDTRPHCLPERKKSAGDSDAGQTIRRAAGVGGSDMTQKVLPDDIKKTGRGRSDF